MRNTKKLAAVVCTVCMLFTNLSIIDYSNGVWASAVHISDNSVNTKNTFQAEARINTEESGENVTNPENTTEEKTSEKVTTVSATTVEATTVQETTTPQPTTQPATQAPTTAASTTPAPTTTTPAPTTTTPAPTTKAAEQPTTVKNTKKTAWGELNGVYYNDKGQAIEGAIAKGIDVSSWQGKINWEKVSKSDVKFAIIRCGYGSDIKSQDDKYFKENVAACEKYGIPYGIYLYSYAKNLTMAKSEVNHVLRMIQEAKAKPTYPIYLDMEDNSQFVLKNSTLAKIADYFCSSMVKAGYKAGVYANLNWWTNKLTNKSFNQWYRWVAQYNSYCAFKGTYQMWQSTSQGTVSGIGGDADINFLFFNECDQKGHTCKWVTTTKATVLKKGEKRYTCQKCGIVTKIKTTAKVKPTGKLNKKSITLKVKKKYKKLKVKNLARGDSVKKYKSSNKKIVTVSKKGVITAGKKKGKATITVTLASGKKLKLKVKVKK